MFKTTKICGFCGKRKLLKYFHNDMYSKDKLKRYCKKCLNLSSRYYKQNNKEKIKRYNKKYKELHKDEISQQRKIYSSSKEYRQKRKIKRNLLRKTNIKENINHRMEVSLRQALRGVKNGRKWEILVGYSSTDLKNHLEKLFTEGMTWKLFLNGKIHIDHIKPKCLFTYHSENDFDFKECWSLKNLQPLWSHDNLKKSYKYEEFK